MVTGAEAWFEANDTSPVWTDASVYSTTCHSHTPSAGDPPHMRMSCKLVELVIFSFTKLLPMYVVPLFRDVTRGELSGRGTEESWALTGVAVIVADPRWAV